MDLVEIQSAFVERTHYDKRWRWTKAWSQVLQMISVAANCEFKFKLQFVGIQSGCERSSSRWRMHLLHSRFSWTVLWTFLIVFFLSLFHELICLKTSSSSRHYILSWLIVVYLIWTLILIHIPDKTPCVIQCSYECWIYWHRIHIHT